MFVPKGQKGFLKYWWDEELHVLKDAAIEFNKISINAGKTKHGPIFIEGNHADRNIERD